LEKSAVQLRVDEKTLNLQDLLFNVPTISEVINQKKGSPTLVVHSDTLNAEEIEEIPSTPSAEESLPVIDFVLF